MERTDFSSLTAAIADNSAWRNRNQSAFWATAPSSSSLGGITTYLSNHSSPATYASASSVLGAN